MFIFSIGLAIPYLVLSIAFGKYFEKLRTLMETTVPQKLLGTIMVVFGIVILTESTPGLRNCLF
jgi:cytochrome c-type biogenesis protein